MPIVQLLSIGFSALAVAIAVWSAHMARSTLELRWRPYVVVRWAERDDGTWLEIYNSGQSSAYSITVSLDQEMPWAHAKENPFSLLGCTPPGQVTCMLLTEGSSEHTNRNHSPSLACIAGTVDGGRAPRHGDLDSTSRSTIGRMVGPALWKTNCRCAIVVARVRFRNVASIAYGCGRECVNTRVKPSIRAGDALGSRTMATTVCRSKTHALKPLERLRCWRL